MFQKAFPLLSFNLALFIYLSYGCQIENVTNWSVPISLNIKDVDRGTIFNRETTAIEGISSISFVTDPPLNGGPYMDVSLNDSLFTITTNEQYPSYEEYETQNLLVLSIDFVCSDGSENRLVIIVNVIDTNNNAPIFLPTNEYEFTVTPPLPPGFLITNCLSGLVVRDIDLTTQRIDFAIEVNPYIAINASTDLTVPKEFQAVLFTTTLIRSLSEPIQLVITATDVDETGDPPLTSTAVVRIVTDSSFQFPEEPRFSEAFYLANYSDEHELDLLSPIYLTQGYDNLVSFEIDLTQEYADYFEISSDENLVTIIIASPLPLNELTVSQIYLVIRVNREFTSGTATSVIVNLPKVQNSLWDLTFDKVLYNGTIQNDVVEHEEIILSNVTEENVIIEGEMAEFFLTKISERQVFVHRIETVPLPNNTYAALQLRVANARAVLLLNIMTEEQIPPFVVFNSRSYVIQVEIEQTGVVGQVMATANNGEAVTYSLLIDNEHLEQRVLISNDGEIHLLAPVNRGVYNFDVLATTVTSQTTGTAPVHLVVEADITCSTQNDVKLPPLIVIDRDEEEPHYNLVVLNTTRYEDCYYTLTSLWPTDQPWLYVDANGLHSSAIDREDPSIAHMALSQIQIELILHCESNEKNRFKRSVNTDNRPEWLNYYDYGPYEWVLTDSIHYNPRRTLVNLIVNDINDNIPIFKGYHNEPIALGYPIPDLEKIILPRALIKLSATDADVGLNAALLYWSSDTRLTVSPSTGYVHAGNSYFLENDDIVTVNVTDQNGTGLTGSIQLKIKLLEINHVAVISVQNAFLEDEDGILSALSSAVGYEIKSLSAVVISNNGDESLNRSSRKTREKNTSIVSLQLLIYGLNSEQEPVLVDNLIYDIINSVIQTVSITNTIPLEDYLQSREIYTVLRRDISLLISTIGLGILLFILITVAAIWFFLKWRKKQNLHKRVSDQLSILSTNVPLGDSTKTDIVTKPSMNINGLKNSELRLQDMLDSSKEVEVREREERDAEELPANIPTENPRLPIVIQSFDKLKDAEEESENEDEFGERRNTKSIVTFNENVEKIIHIVDLSPNPDMEIFKF